MGNCSSAPRVKDDPKADSNPEPSKLIPPPEAEIPEALPNSGPSGPLSTQPSVSGSLPQSVVGSLPSMTTGVFTTTETISTDDVQPKPVTCNRKSKSMELPGQSPQIIVQFLTPQPGDVLVEEEDTPDNGDLGNGGVWKVRRRVGRRLSLEVQKKPTANDSASPAWGMSASAQVVPQIPAREWEADTDSLLNQPAEVEVTVYDVTMGAEEALPSFSKPSRNYGASAAHPTVANAVTDAAGDAATVATSVGIVITARSRLGRVVPPGYSERVDDQLSPEATAAEADQRERDEERDEKVRRGLIQGRRRGRRLSLEVENRPDLAVLAAIRRTSSAPITAKAAAAAVGDGKKNLQREGGGSGGDSVADSVFTDSVGDFLGDTTTNPSSASSVSFARSFDTPPTLRLSAFGVKECGQSANISPSDYSATLIDFAVQAAKTRGGIDSRRDGTGEEDLTLLDSVKVAEVLVNSAGAADSPQYVAKRRKSRRLSLEIEKPPPEALVAAVRKAYGVPNTIIQSREGEGMPQGKMVDSGVANGESPTGAISLYPARGNSARGHIRVSDGESYVNGGGGEEDLDDFSSWGAGGGATALVAAFTARGAAKVSSASNGLSSEEIRNSSGANEAGWSRENEDRARLPVFRKITRRSVEGWGS